MTDHRAERERASALVDKWYKSTWQGQDDGTVGFTELEWISLEKAIADLDAAAYQRGLRDAITVVDALYDSHPEAHTEYHCACLDIRAKLTRLAEGG